MLGLIPPLPETAVDRHGQAHLCSCLLPWEQVGHKGRTGEPLCRPGGFGRVNVYDQDAVNALAATWPQFEGLVVAEQQSMCEFCVKQAGRTWPEYMR